MKLIVGLGNPGRAYADSRHNFGFQCVNLFARNQSIEFAKRQSKARIGFGEIAGEKVLLAKPGTYMNLSGESVAPLVRYYRIDLADLLVVYDDLDFTLGKIRIREGGGSGGHNGMKSIINRLGSQEFPRIRVGIGPIEDDEPSGVLQEIRTPNYVLGHFTAEEKAVVDEVCPRVAEAIDCILTEGIATAMNKYNSS
ncbi:MAG: aminoacyl-tRNA hydrolase [Chloroflexota bacterium]|nr:aminoacyl-tRNA hydrolase [Chloroflexota bacterium]